MELYVWKNSLKDEESAERERRKHFPRPALDLCCTTTPVSIIKKEKRERDGSGKEEEVDAAVVYILFNDHA